MLEKILEMLRPLEAIEDIYYYYIDSENLLLITINDFEGFDSEWNEIPRVLRSPLGVQELLELIEGECFEDFSVSVNYASEEI